MSAWNKVQYAITLQAYKDNWSRLQDTYKDKPILISYLQREWIGPFHAYFVTYFTNQLTHFGNGSSNRAEGAHRAIKQQFNSPQLDIQ